MRIALVIGTLNLGGAERQLCRLGRELAERGHHVKVFALFEGGPLEENLHGDGMEFEIFGWKGFVYRDPDHELVLGELTQSVVTLFRFWRRLWDFKPQVCHAYLFWAYALAMPGAWLGRIPVRISARRGLSSDDALRPRERVVQAVANLATTMVIANAEAVVEDAERTEPCFPKRVEVIPNGVDVPKQLADVQHEPPEAVVVANLKPLKGHADLLDALALLRNPPHVMLVGDGPEREALEAQVASLGLEETVTFIGRTLDVPLHLSHAQFAIHPSHSEGMPNAVLEAMSYGLPVVATPVGGVVELQEDGVTGRIVPVGDPRPLAEAIEQLTSSPGLRTALGHAARQRAEEFSWDRCTEKHLELYGRLISERKDRLSVFALRDPQE